jgi:hypothetical protein
MQVGDPSSKFVPGFPAAGPSHGSRKAGAAPANPATRTDRTGPAQSAESASSASRPDAAKNGGARELMRVRTLEEAVKLLDGQGRLPPRGSLVDLSA